MPENWDETFASQVSDSITSKHIQIKTLIEEKSNLFKSYMANGRLIGDCAKLKVQINVIKSSKKFHTNLTKKLIKLRTSSKTF